MLAALQPLTYTPETASLLPQMLALAPRGDLAPLFAASPALSGNLAEQMNAALHFSVTCAEDVPRIAAGGESGALRRTADAPAGRAGARRLRRLAARQRMPADFRRAGARQARCCCCPAAWTR